MKNEYEKNKLSKKKTPIIAAFFVLALLCLIIFYAYNYFSGKNKQFEPGEDFKSQQIDGQNGNEEKKLKRSEYDCYERPKEGHVRIEGNIIRPDWLDSQKPLFVVVDWEMYPVSSDNGFCIFAPPKIDIISVVSGDEITKKILLFALVANKDKNITIDTQSTAVALIFSGTQSNWRQNSLEDSIAAFNYIQQDERTEKLADAISREQNFSAENVTNDDSEVANAYQQSISSLESKRYQISEKKAELSLIVILNPVDFYQDSDRSYFINGKISTVENISPRLASVELVAGDIKEGSQLGIFFDANKLPPPKNELNAGFNDKRVRIKAVFESATGRFTAEELSIL